MPETGTVVEIQVTTAPMLNLKNSAAHGVYRVGRESSPHGVCVGAYCMHRGVSHARDGPCKCSRASPRSWGWGWLHDVDVR